MYFSLFILLFSITIICLLSITLTVRFYNKEKKSYQTFQIEVLKKIEEDRKRIANDLHDSCGNILTEFSFQVNDMKNKFRKNNLLNKSFSELSKKIHRLNNELINNIENIHPKELLIDKWEAAIENLAFRFKLDGRFIICDIQKCSKTTLETQLQSYRIIQELISNIFKHSFPQQLTLQIFEENNHIVVVFLFNKDSSNKFNTLYSFSRGELSIQNRLTSINGSIKGPNKIQLSSKTQLFELILTFPI
jgi:signal transduction histidine kinase